MGGQENVFESIDRKQMKMKKMKNNPLFCPLLLIYDTRCETLLKEGMKREEINL
jgi:hypothetical protein